MPKDLVKPCPNCGSNNIKVFPDDSGICYDCKFTSKDFFNPPDSLLKKKESDEKDEMIQRIYSSPGHDDIFPPDFNPVKTTKGMNLIALGFKLFIISIIGLLVLGIIFAFVFFSFSTGLLLMILLFAIIFSVIGLVGEILAIVGVVFLHIGRKEYNVGKYWLNLGTVFIISSFICGIITRIAFSNLEASVYDMFTAVSIFILQVAAYLFFAIGFAVLPREVISQSRWEDFLKGLKSLMMALGLLFLMIFAVFIVPPYFGGVCCFGLAIGLIIYLILYITGLIAYMRAYENGPRLRPGNYYGHQQPMKSASWLDEPVQKPEDEKPGGETKICPNCGLETEAASDCPICK